MENNIITAEIVEVKERAEGQGFIVYTEAAAEEDEFGTTTIRKYLRGYKTLKEGVIDSMVGKKIQFSEDAVTVSDYTLPEGHEAAGTKIKRYWVNGAIKVLA